MKSFKVLSAVTTTVALVAAAASTQLATAAPVSGCAALGDTVYQAVAADGSTLFTPWSSEVAAAAKAGFAAHGTAFRASRTAQPGLVGVHRLYQKSSKDFLYTVSASEVTSAKAKYGYVDQGVRFYVSSTASGCTTVPRLVKGTKHRLAATAADSSALARAGWKVEGTKLYVAPPAAAGQGGEPVTPPVTPPPVTSQPSQGGQTGSFTFAVIPDTQLEVLRSNDVRLAARNQWLASQKVAWVAQTGDLVNWDTDTHEQYQRAKTGMNVLTTNKVPYTVAVGNHDTMATGVGGSARPGKTWELVRDTRTLNSYFSASDFGDVGGAFEPRKIDNVFTTYSAGGKKWMVITLEFCARKAVIEWARGVVASHPDYNVIISTHSYLRSDGSIGTRNDGYGDTAPSYVYDHLVKQYPNIKMVFSGHVGYARKARVDTGVNGNKIYSFLTTFHEGKTNPVRMVTVNTKDDTIASTIYAPFTNKTYNAYDEKLSGVGIR